jgi:hypothetical protein
MAWISTYEYSPLVNRGTNQKHEAYCATTCQTGSDPLSDSSMVFDNFVKHRKCKGHRWLLKAFLDRREHV